MLRRVLVASLGLVCALSAVTEAQESGQPGRRGRRGQGQREGIRFGVQLYTFHRFSFGEAIEKAGEAGARAVEGFAWHKIGLDTGDAQLNQKAPGEAIEKARAKLREARADLAGYYVGDFGKTEDEARPYFEFAKKMGIRYFVSEPDASQLRMLDKLAQEYGIRLAIHNHPKDPNKPEYKYWDPKEVMAAIKPFSRHIGVCADTGHMLRSGIDPVEGLKTYEGRLISLHIKDVNEKGAKGKDVPLGTGVGNVKGQLEELKRQNFSGFAMIEYESNLDNNVSDVRQSLRYLRTTARELGMMGPRGQDGRGENGREGRGGRGGRGGRNRGGQTE